MKCPKIENGLNTLRNTILRLFYIISKYCIKEFLITLDNVNSILLT